MQIPYSFVATINDLTFTYNLEVLLHFSIILKCIKFGNYLIDEKKPILIRVNNYNFNPKTRCNISTFLYYYKRWYDYFQNLIIVSSRFLCWNQVSFSRFTTSTSLGCWKASRVSWRRPGRTWTKRQNNETTNAVLTRKPRWLIWTTAAETYNQE